MISETGRGSAVDCKGLQSLLLARQNLISPAPEAVEDDEKETPKA